MPLAMSQDEFDAFLRRIEEQNRATGWFARTPDGTRMSGRAFIESTGDDVDEDDEDVPPFIDSVEV